MPIKNDYPDGVCPDCAEPIPADAEEGSECGNCGHIFFEIPGADDELLCYVCGNPMVVNADGTTNHLLLPDSGDGIDYDQDADHVAYLDSDDA